MLGQLRRRRAYAPTSNTASQDNHEKINSWVSFIFPLHDEYGAPLGGPSGRRSSAITNHLMTGPLGNSEFCFPRISMFPETKSRETLRFMYMTKLV